jgi:Tfp pilus assembly PilM family ATPase
MRALPVLKPPGLFLEIARHSLEVLDGDDGLELPLERLPQGRLTDACKQALVPKLREFFGRKAWRPRPRALCAIDARGVSLRRLALPASSNADVPRLLLLQIESEFPLPPDELAWGYGPIEGAKPSADGRAAQQEFLVVAVRKQVIEEYADLLSRSGVTPVFTLAALARSYACPQLPASRAVLDVGHDQSEWMSFDDGHPSALRVLPWGIENTARSITPEPGLSRDEAERPPAATDDSAPAGGELAQELQIAPDSASDGLVATLSSLVAARRVYLTGRHVRLGGLARQLASRLGSGVACEPLESPPAPGRSAAILGLRKIAGSNGGRLPLILQTKAAVSKVSLAHPAAWKWAGLAVLLALLSLSLPYAEALLLKPRLANRLAAIKADQARLATLDRELGFLRYLKQNQPPYLEALFVLAKAAAPGSKLDLVSLNRRGDVALRGFMRDSQQVLDLRSKLIDSGFFSSVTVEEQTPTPDRQRVLVRISAQWKPIGTRESRAGDAPASDAGKPATSQKGNQATPPAAVSSPPPGAAAQGTPPKDRRE